MGITLKDLLGSRTRRIVVVILFSAVALSTGVYAYWVSLLLPRTEGPSVSITSTPLQLSFGLDKTEYATTDNLTLYFSLRNISNMTVSVTKTKYWNFGHEPLLFPIYEVTTNANGVSSDYLEEFQFRLLWVDGNGTVVADLPNQLLSFPVVYSISLEPNACLNQTLRISIPGYCELTNISLRTGVFQIRGLLSDIYLEGSLSAVTLETPSIGLTIN